MTFNSNYCRETCLGHSLAVSTYSLGYQPKEPLITLSTTNYYYVSAVAFYYIVQKRGQATAVASYLQLYKLNKEQDYILYSNGIDLVEFLEDDRPTELNVFLPLDFKKFMDLKRSLLRRNSVSFSLKLTMVLLICFFKKAQIYCPCTS